MTSRPRRNGLETERKIYFYRVDAGNDANGTPILFNPTASFDILAALDYEDFGSSGPYLDTADGNAFCCWVDNSQGPQRLRYVRIRKTGLPSLLQNGHLGPLNIAADSGLAEEIHLIFSQIILWAATSIFLDHELAH